MERRKQAAEAEERARRDKEEAERAAALAAAQPKQAEAVMDRPDAGGSPTREEQQREYFSMIARIFYFPTTSFGVCVSFVKLTVATSLNESHCEKSKSASCLSMIAFYIGAFYEL